MALEFGLEIDFGFTSMVEFTFGSSDCKTMIVTWTWWALVKNMFKKVPFQIDFSRYWLVPVSSAGDEINWYIKLFKRKSISYRYPEVMGNKPVIHNY